MISQELLVPIALGISLAAATGFRVFLPLVVMGLGAREGLKPVDHAALGDFVAKKDVLGD